METVVRVSVIYLVILLGLRVLGKREFSQLSPLELVTLLLIPELVSQALVRGESSMTTALVGVSTLFSLVFLTSALMQQSTLAEEVVNGTPAVLVAHGQVVERAMNQERVTPEELMMEIRKAGLEALAQVKWAVLETDGKISIVAESEQEGPPEQEQALSG